MKKIIFFFLLMNLVVFGVNAAEEENNPLKLKKSELEYKTSSSAICISVNSIGDIAIGFNDKHINVYDNNGEFKYAFAFQFDGSYVFEFDKHDNIMLFPARGDSLYIYDTDASLLNKQELNNPIENDKLYRTLFAKKSITVYDTTYNLKQPFGYVKLTKIDSNGTKVIYEIGLSYMGKIIIGIFITIFILIVILIVLSRIKSEKEEFRKLK